MKLAMARNLFITLICLQLSLPVGATEYIISGSSACGLADAIGAANLDETVGNCPAGAGEDTMLLAENITLSAALPTIRSNITITTDNLRFTRVISGDRAHAIFNVEDGGRLTLRQLDLIDGHSLGMQGGALRLVQAHAHLTGVRFEDNWAQMGGGALGMALGSSVTCNQCRFVSNMSGHGGAIWVSGVASSIVLNNSLVYYNAADRGGGVFIRGGSATLVNTTFSHNVAGLGQGFDILSIGANITIMPGTIISPEGINQESA